jgi:hypothetical protein
MGARRAHFNGLARPMIDIFSLFGPPMRKRKSTRQGLLPQRRATRPITTMNQHHQEEAVALLIPPIPPVAAAAAIAVEPAKLKLLEARFGADQENSNSQTSFDSPSLTYQSAPASQQNGAAVAIPSWQRMQNQHLAAPKSSLKNNVRKQAHPQRKSVVLVVQESPPTKNGKQGSTHSNGSAVRILCESK